MNTIVLDATVIIKWFREQNEEKVVEARGFLKQIQLGEIELAAPDILFYEVLNVAIWDKTVTGETWVQALEVLYKLPKKIYPLNGFSSQEVLTTAKSLGLTAYDASYLVLARNLGTKLITADKKLIAVGEKWVKAL